MVRREDEIEGLNNVDRQKNHTLVFLLGLQTIGAPACRLTRPCPSTAARANGPPSRSSATDSQVLSCDALESLSRSCIKTAGSIPAHQPTSVCRKNWRCPNLIRTPPNNLLCWGFALDTLFRAKRPTAAWTSTLNRLIPTRQDSRYTSK